MTEQEKTLHAEAVETLRDAEREIEAIIDSADVQAALAVAQGDDFDSAKQDALATVEDARTRAHVLAHEAIDKINALMEKAGDPAEAQRLTAVLHAAVENPRPGVRFSQHLDEAAELELDRVEANTLRLEGALNAVTDPFFDKLNAAMESASRPAATPDHDHALHSDTVDLFGTQVTVPGGLYTVVFGVLAIVTIIEVAMAESGLPGSIAYPLLSALSIGKAVLVVLYYMHLREDSRIFAWAFGLPLGMAGLIILFLLLVNPVVY